LTPTRRPLCPRCRKLPVPDYSGMGPQPRYCGERSCYDAFYDRKRQEAKDAARTDAVQRALVIEGQRLRKEMLRKVAAVVGVEGSPKRVIAQRLPRGGALVILNDRERREVLIRLDALDVAVARAIEVLLASRLSAHRAVGRALRDHRNVLGLFGRDYLLSEVSER